MRYPRNVKIFRGGVDAAPFAGLFFCTMLFMVLFYSHVFFPGVPIAIGGADEPAALDERTVEVLKDRSIRFLGETYDLGSFETELSARAKQGALPPTMVLVNEPGAAEAALQRVENLLTEAGVQIKFPGSRLDLPPSAGFAGVPNPVVVVGVNLNGQIFFQHQKTQETELQMRLAEAVEKSGEPLTLLLQADRNVPLEKVTQISQIARKAGISRIVIRTRPSVE
jgi:biopolymer transport protein ExbD